MIVDVMEHVLNELTYQATATPNREVYSTVFADDDGVIRHQHIIEHPDFLETRKSSIKFSPAFFDHLRRLSQQRKEMDHRLAGGVHSHPNTGQPRQSPADKRFARKVWRNQRNTMFIVGIKEGDGPDEWTISDDGKEVRRQSNEYIVRIRAFSGENNPKQIRLHQDMGQ
jgi:proteasome lid subunit RPN8/RPN11